MCIIAGYTGDKPAAPIIIEMLKKTEYIDGGLSTGIATIHEGKLYMRKVVGDVDTLIRETDALGNDIARATREVLENSRLKPVMPAFYEGLWSFYREGKLRSKPGTRSDANGVKKKIMKFRLE